MRRDLIVPKGKCPLDILAEQEEEIRNTWIVLSESIVSQDFPRKGVITKSDRRFTSHDYFKLETTEEYPKTILTYCKFRNTGWYFLEEAVARDKSKTAYVLGFMNEPKGITFVTKRKISIIKRTDLIVPRDKWSLDVLAEQEEKLRNTWIFLHNSVWSQLGMSEGAITIHRASSPENMYMEWETKGEQPKTKIAHSDDIRFPRWYLLTYASVNKITFGNIARVRNPKEVVFVKMEGA